MDHENISEIVKVAICICAEDGLVSETEENAVYELISKRFPNYSQDSFSKAVKDFFSSDKRGRFSSRYKLASAFIFRS